MFRIEKVCHTPNAPLQAEAPTSNGFALGLIQMQHACDELVKLRPDESIDLQGLEAWHINAAPCTHTTGKTYAFVNLSRFGGKARPWVDLDVRWLGHLVQVHHFESLWDVPEEIVAQLLGNPGDHTQLQALMLARYGVHKGWTADNAAQQPVVISHFVRAADFAPNGYLN